jgi:hypothetical protein
MINIEANNTAILLLGSEYSQRLSINFGPELDKVIDTLMALRYENDQQLNAVQDLSELVAFVGE